VRRGIPLLRRLLRRREGGGSPSPACTYGRVGGRSRRRCLGGGGAGGGMFGVGAAFSGDGALRGSASPRAIWRSSGPGVVLGFLCRPSDPWWRWIWWPAFWTGRGRRLQPASEATSSAARWSSRRGRALAVAVHRQMLRREADDSCGVKHGCSLAVARRWWTIFVVVAGGVVDLRSGFVSPAYGSFLFVFVLYTVYVVCC